MIKTVTETIRGRKVDVTQFPTGRGLAMVCRVAQFAAPILGSAAAPLARLVAGSANIMEQEIASALAALVSVDLGDLGKALAEQADPEKLPALTRDLLECTRVDGQEAGKNFDMLFVGDYGFLVECAVFAARANFGSFFDGWASAAAAPIALAEPKAAPRRSTGGVGG